MVPGMASDMASAWVPQLPEVLGNIEVGDNIEVEGNIEVEDNIEVEGSIGAEVHDSNLLYDFVDDDALFFFF